MDLAVNYSPALRTLVRQQDPALAGIHCIEVGGWMNPEYIWRCRQELPHWRFLYHAGEQVFAASNQTADLFHLTAALAGTQSPWLSVHLTFMANWRASLAVRGFTLPDLPVRVYAERFIRKANALQQAVGLPLLLENMALPPQAEPDWIKTALTETGSRLLLDLAHARIAAERLDLNVHAYLEQFPLDQVAEVHISGSRRYGSRRIDAHESLEEDDYTLLDWTLQRTQPEVLTLEYSRAARPLAQQILRLSERTTLR